MESATPTRLQQVLRVFICEGKDVSSSHIFPDGPGLGSLDPCVPGDQQHQPRVHMGPRALRGAGRDVLALLPA